MFIQKIDGLGDIFYNLPGRGDSNVNAALFVDGRGKGTVIECNDG